MAGFIQDTTATKLSPHHYQITLSDRWEIWGPNGGYLAAIALRGAGEGFQGFIPASFYCQYLAVAKFEPVDIFVNVVRDGRSAKSVEVSISQNDKSILKALVWLTLPKQDIEHCFVELPDSWVPLEQSPNDHHGWPFKFWDNFEVKALEPKSTPDRKGNGGICANWFRFLDNNDDNDYLSNPFINAARSVVLLDTLQWPATWLAYDEGDLNIVAPSLDLSVQFHHNHSTCPWLFCETRSPHASDGLISGCGKVWDQDGRLLASGSSQLLCMPIKR